MNIIEARDIEFSYGAFPVLKGVNLTVAPGEVVALTGENGCGKSTFLSVLIGQNRPSSGTVRIFGKDVFQPTATGRVRAEIPRGVGYVPQTNVVNKISFPITSRELVVQGLAREFGVVKIARREHYARAEALLERMDLSEFSRVPFGELSGGLQRRVLIARALIDEPQLIFLDEPIAGVDKKSIGDFLRQLEELRVEKDLTIVMVSHELEIVTPYVAMDSVYVMEEGQLRHA